MLFNSFEFLAFLPIVFLLYWFVFRKRLQQNFLLLVASYVFYGWWDWRFLVLIVFTSLCSFISGLLLERHEGRRLIQRIISTCNIIINICILGVFKYYDFFVDNLNMLANKILGYELGCTTLQIILPVGISFYTFQALSYSIDVYRQRIRATHNPLDFFAYISFFPQLVAGPIERAIDLLPQFQKDRRFDYAASVDGLRQMLWGFFKKIVVADRCAAMVNQYWNLYPELPGSMILLSGVLFTFQIYCDFSGYSDIAIGCARLLGFNLTRNFRYPYFSRSIPEFWRNWHISLTKWFTDYIYIPLGGNRGPKWKTIRNVFIVWGLSGLWHGANWTFICWGLFHAFILNIYNVGGFRTQYNQVVASGRLFPTIKEFFQMLLTFSLSAIGWIIFRAESMPQAVAFFQAIFDNQFLNLSVFPTKELFYAGLAIIFYVILEWNNRDKQHALQSISNFKFFKYRGLRWSFYSMLIILLIMNTGKGQDFIYFQF